MKISTTKAGTITITGITEREYTVMHSILTTANDRCFQEQEQDGDYYSGDDFVCTLDEKEREALRQLCKSL